MKLSEDEKIKIQKTILDTGDYAELRLKTVDECTNPPEIELNFGVDKSIYLVLADQEDASGYLREYKKEIESKLLGNTWGEILAYEFRFDEASRMSS